MTARLCHLSIYAVFVVHLHICAGIKSRSQDAIQSRENPVRSRSCLELKTEGLDHRIVLQAHFQRQKFLNLVPLIG